MKRTVMLIACLILAAPLSVISDSAISEPVATVKTDDKMQAFEETRTCLHKREIRATQVLNDEYVVFRGKPGFRWVNRLAAPCQGLEKNMDISMKTQRTQEVCARDRLFGMDPTNIDKVPAHCALGVFLPVDWEELKAFKRSLWSDNGTKPSVLTRLQKE